MTRRGSRTGSVVTALTVVALLATAAVSVLGFGSADHAIADYNPVAWLFSSDRGEVARVNGEAAKVDTRVPVPGAAQHPVELSQSDRYLLLRDAATGQVHALDLTSLQISASLASTPGLGTRMVVNGGTAYIVDAVRGTVQPVDPKTLHSTGAPLTFSPGLRGGEFDGDGRLWLALPGQGTVVAVGPPAGAGQPTPVRTEPVADPNHDLSVSSLDSGAAVLDNTSGQLVTVGGNQVQRVDLRLDGRAVLPARTSGAPVVVTVPQTRRVLAVSGGQVTEVKVPGTGALDPAVAWAGRFYCADPQAGIVYVLDAAGTVRDQIRFPGPGSLEVGVHGDRLYINAPDGATARVVDEQNHVTAVDKLPNGVLGGDPPRQPPRQPAPPKAPRPRTGPPGPVTSLVATAGDASAHLAWGRASDNGSAILRYIVEGDGQRHEVGAGQRSIDLGGLTNGQVYRFTVYAVNAKGAGPPREANPVVPTADAPQPPTGVSAAAQPDGTVTLQWSPAAGGRPAKQYQVTAIGPDDRQMVGQVAATSLALPAGTLGYGTQYAFTVTAIDDRGTASGPSPVSASVVPYTKPGRPTGLRVSTVQAKGAVRVSWGAAAANGRAIDRYELSAGGRSLTVSGRTSVDWSGFGDGQRVSVSVRAVNAAGAGPAAGPASAQTLAPPRLTITGYDQTFTSIIVSFSIQDGGADASCKLAVSGAGSAGGSCNRLTVGGLAPGVSYRFTLTATNVAGTDTATGSRGTNVLYGSIACTSTDGACDDGVGIYSTPRQTESALAGRAYNGDRKEAVCKVKGGLNDFGYQPPYTSMLNAGPYNDNKKSDMWVKVSRDQARYVPWVWLDLDNDDDLGALPAC
jgi:Fibronectin type III domain